MSQDVLSFRLKLFRILKFKGVVQAFVEGSRFALVSTLLHFLG